jgi:hypothetical protein
MARGNQREKAREKAQKAAGGVKSKTTVCTSAIFQPEEMLTLWND